MPTLDELLNTSNEVATCTVNPDTREIIVPEKYKILGVFSDEKVTKIPFIFPKVVGNNVDLTEYNLYINYQNAIGRHNVYLVDDVAVSGDNITFSWLLSRDVTLSSGVVKYSVCAKKLNGDSISNEWNTAIANGVVIQGLEATQAIVEENSDIIEAILSKAHTHANKSVLDKFAESNGKPTYDGKDLGGGASTSEGVSYTNAQLPNAANVKTALDELVPKSHSHANKDALDKISVSNGKLQYNGSNVGLKGDKGTDGTTPHIGDNGNWYLGTTDTGKPSRGAKGDKGDPGAPGANKADYQARFDGKFLQIAYSYVAGGGATNSKEHYEHCAKNDYDAVKADLRLTSDNKLVCCHDAGITLNADGRIVSYDSSNSTAIHEMTKAQFMALEFNTMYDGIRCHTCDLETFLQICKNAGKIAYITIRGEYVEATVAALVAAVQDASMVSRTIINSFTADALTAVRAAEPDLYLSLVIDPFTESERTTALTYAQGKKTCQICLYYNSNVSHTLAEMAADSTITAWISSCIAAGIRLIGAQADAAADTNTLLKLGCCGVQTRVSRLTNAYYDGLDISALNIAATSTDDATTLTFSDAKGNQKTAEIPKLQPTDAQVQAGVESWMDKNSTPTEVWSKNVLNVNDTDVSMGYIASSGQINGSDTYWVSGYIPAKQGDVLRSSLNGSTANFYYVAEYNSAKRFLARASKSVNTYTVSNESAAYIRVSWKTSSVSYQNEKAMLTLNNTDLSFEAYGSHMEGGLGEYLILTSPNGTKYSLSVSDDAVLSAVPV